MTPWRYLAASGPETESSLREVRRAMPEGVGPDGAACRGAEREKARRGVVWGWGLHRRRGPLIEIRNIPGTSQDLFRSMCAGMDGWLKRQKAGIEGWGRIWTDMATGEDLFTYGGPTKGNKEKAKRRDDVHCRGFCDTGEDLPTYL